MNNLLAGSTLPKPAVAQRRRLPIRWARGRYTGYWLARRLPFQPPTVLVLSFPRSGSSWVGDTLGRAANAAYLREPINQVLKAQQNTETVFPVEAEAPDPAYLQPALRAFAGLPAFTPHVVKWPAQWRLLDRPRRRLVIKEVNPMAASFLVRRFRPRVIFLVRHPAPVALSYTRRGWWSLEWTTWQEMGDRQGKALRAALDGLNDHADCRMVQYEALCETPAALFEDLFAFAGLTWNAASAEHVRQSTLDGDRSQPYATARDSKQMANAWKTNIEAGALQALREGYAQHDLPWYRSEQDWQPAR
jgi:hypothetical protein